MQICTIGIVRCSCLQTTSYSHIRWCPIQYTIYNIHGALYSTYIVCRYFVQWHNAHTMQKWTHISSKICQILCTCAECASYCAKYGMFLHMCTQCASYCSVVTKRLQHIGQHWQRGGLVGWVDRACGKLYSTRHSDYPTLPNQSLLVGRIPQLVLPRSLVAAFPRGCQSAWWSAKRSWNDRCWWHRRRWQWQRWWWGKYSAPECHDASMPIVNHNTVVPVQCNTLHKIALYCTE